MSEILLQKCRKIAIDPSSYILGYDNRACQDQPVHVRSLVGARVATYHPPQNSLTSP